LQISILHGLIFQGIVSGLFLAQAIPCAGVAPSVAAELQILLFRLGLLQYSLVLLHVTALAARKVLDASACGFEGVMNHQLKISMR